LHSRWGGATFQSAVAALIAGSPSRTKDQIKENGEILKRIYCHYTPIDTFARDCITGRVDLTSD